MSDLELPEELNVYARDIACGERIEKLYYVTGHARTGHVGTNYTPSHNRSCIIWIGVNYLHSVTCVIKPIKYFSSAKIVWL